MSLACLFRLVSDPSFVGVSECRGFQVVPSTTNPDNVWRFHAQEVIHFLDRLELDPATKEAIEKDLSNRVRKSIPGNDPLDELKKVLEHPLTSWVQTFVTAEESRAPRPPEVNGQWIQSDPGYLMSRDDYVHQLLDSIYLDYEEIRPPSPSWWASEMRTRTFYRLCAEDEER